jgi:hypothetical protein
MAGPVSGADTRVTLEITGADQTPSVSSTADWGWWNPSKYDEAWAADESSSFGIADVRMLVAGGDYTIIVEGEFYPSLEATGTYVDPDSGETVTQSLTLTTSIYDLGFGKWFGRDTRNGFLPWIGATYMDIGENLATAPPPDSGEPGETDRADAGLWGVVAGADASVTVWGPLDLSGRLLVRWASGTRTAHITSQEPGGSGGGEGEVEVSDSIDHTMWGLDIGLRWHAVRDFWVEAGWRLRDRSVDGGPARYSGAQIKAAYRF